MENVRFALEVSSVQLMISTRLKENTHLDCAHFTTLYVPNAAGIWL